MLPGLHSGPAGQGRVTVASALPSAARSTRRSVGSAPSMAGSSCSTVATWAPSGESARAS